MFGFPVRGSASDCGGNCGSNIVRIQNQIGKIGVYNSFGHPVNNTGSLVLGNQQQATFFPQNLCSVNAVRTPCPSASRPVCAAPLILPAVSHSAQHVYRRFVQQRIFGLLAYRHFRQGSRSLNPICALSAGANIEHGRFISLSPFTASVTSNLLTLFSRLAKGPVNVAGIMLGNKNTGGKVFRQRSLEGIFCTTGGPPVETPITTRSLVPFPLKAWQVWASVCLLRKRNEDRKHQEGLYQYRRFCPRRL